jgi:hypothetical protein
MTRTASGATSSTTRASRGDGQEQTEAVDGQRTDRVADEIPEEGILVLAGLDGLTLGGVGHGQDQRTM